MANNDTQEIDRGLSVLQRNEEKLIELCERMLKAGSGTIYAVDVLLVGAIHRFIKVSTGIRSAISIRNFTCAAPLVRLQLDSVARVFAATLVDDKAQFLESMLKDVPVSKMKDRDGKRMTDAYLVERLSKKTGLEPLKVLYERTSGFVHFSYFHLLAITQEIKDHRFTFSVGGPDNYFPDRVYLEVLTATNDIYSLLIAFVRDWINEKDPENPVHIIVDRPTK